MQGPVLLISLLIVVALSMLLLAIRVNRKEAAYKNLLMKANAAVEQHMVSLVRKRAQLVRLDPYGKPMLDQWNREIEYFVAHHIRPVLSLREQAALACHGNVIAELVAVSSASTARSSPVLNSFRSDMSPSDFEVFCAERLRHSGWDARVTARGRDQGIDVIAEKSGIRIVLQCKLYTGPVGNKAVQEIAAGVAHEKAHLGAVVSNNRYTSPAEQLAATNGILLLHYSDLDDLDHFFGRSSVNQAHARRQAVNL
jgi:restriction system protein